MDLNNELARASSRESGQTHYVGTYDNGSGYREFIDTPTLDKNEAERSLNRACGMDERVEECYYSEKHKCWILAN